MPYEEKRLYDGQPVYKLRAVPGGHPVIGIPPELAEVVPIGTRFMFNVTDRGFEYIWVNEDPPPPRWLQILRSLLEDDAEAAPGDAAPITQRP